MQGRRESRPREQTLLLGGAKDSHSSWGYRLGKLTPGCLQLVKGLNFYFVQSFFRLGSDESKDHARSAVLVDIVTSHSMHPTVSRWTLGKVVPYITARSLDGPVFTFT